MTAATLPRSTRASARWRARAAGAAIIVGALACGSSGTGVDVRTSGGPLGAYRVEVLNASSVPLQSLSITTGEDEPALEFAQLAPGARSAARTVGALHENPFVIVTVAGERRSYHPVEGFSGFNPRLEPGRYVIRLRWNAETKFLETTVVPAN